jgi:hypothetical protein
MVIPGKNGIEALADKPFFVVTRNDDGNKRWWNHDLS